ncbi:MAG: hemin ABC transporter substrate-binding protein, partial [Deltaproteobacteria bacterium]
MKNGSRKKTPVAFLTACFFCGMLQAYAAGEGQSPYWLGGVSPKAPPARMVSLAPSITEILFELGQGTRLVGVTRFDDYPPEVKKLPKVGGFVDFSVEAIAALSPDAVLCTPNLAGRQRLEPLLKLGIPVLVIPSYTLE